MKQVDRAVRVAAVMPQRRGDVVVAGQAEDGVAQGGHHPRARADAVAVEGLGHHLAQSGEPVDAFR